MGQRKLSTHNSYVGKQRTVRYENQRRYLFKTMEKSLKIKNHIDTKLSLFEGNKIAFDFNDLLTQYYSPTTLIQFSQKGIPIAPKSLKNAEGLPEYFYSSEIRVIHLSLLRIIIQKMSGFKMKGQDTKRSILRKKQTEITIKVDLNSAKQKNIPLLLKKIVPFDSQNHSQVFYREISSTEGNNKQVVRLGWRISQIGREQQDLTLFCIALLQSSLNLPISFFTRNQVIPSKKDTYMKFLWLEGFVLNCKKNEEEEGENKQTFEIAFYQFIEENVVGLFKSFIQNQISWQVLAKTRFSQEEIVKKLREDLMVRLMLIFRKFTERIGLIIDTQQHKQTEKKKNSDS